MPARRLGLFAILALIYQAVVNSWDWWSRTSGLDPYFGFKQNTFWGHAVRALFDANPLWVFGLIALFGVLWGYESYWKRSKEALNDNVRPDLLIALDDEKRKREWAERERDAAQQVKDHAITSMQTAMEVLRAERDEYSEKYRRWVGVMSLAVSYARINDMIPILEDAAKSMDSRLPPRGQPFDTSFSEQFAQSAILNDQEFAKLRPRLIQVMSEMRAQHGLSNARLTEDKLTCKMYGSKQVRAMVEGASELVASLRELIADAAVKAIDNSGQHE